MFIKSLMKRIAIQRMVIIIKTRKRNTTKHNKTQQNATQHNAHRFVARFPIPKSNKQSIKLRFRNK